MNPTTDEVLDALEDMWWQHAYDPDGANKVRHSGHLSANEHAEEILAEAGRIVRDRNYDADVYRPTTPAERQARRNDELAIALVTDATPDEFPPPDRIQIHGAWYTREPIPAAESVVRYSAEQDPAACRFCGRREPEVRIGYSKFHNAWICGRLDCQEVSSAGRPA